MLPSSPVVIGAAAVIALLVLLVVVRRLRAPSSEARESKRAHEAAQEREPPVANAIQQHDRQHNPGETQQDGGDERHVEYVDRDCHFVAIG